jgi:hypothetical protein
MVDMEDDERDEEEERGGLYEDAKYDDLSK